MARTVTINVNVAASQGARNVTKLSNTVTKLGRNTTSASNTVSKGFNGMGSAASVALGTVAANAITAAVTQLKQLATQAIRTGADFEQQMAELSAITGIAGQDLEFLGDAAQEAALETGRSAQDQVEAYKLLASNIDIATAGGVEGLKAMGREVVTLSQAAGVDLNTAANTVASTINQFNLEASESSRVVNSLAAGSKFGAAEVDDLGLALKNSGTTAAGANVSLEETIGALEILAQNGQKGAEAGTGLRNVITILRTESQKLADAGIKNVNVETDGLTATLQKLRPILGDASQMAAVFGRENLNAAQILIRNAGAVGEMTEAVTGTDTAMEQAVTQMDTFNGTLKVIDTVIADLETAMFDAFGDELRALLQRAIGLYKENRANLAALFEFIVTNGVQSFRLLDAVIRTVFTNFGEIATNTITGLPRLFWIAAQLSGKNFAAFVRFLGKQVSRIGDRFKALGNLILGAVTLDRERVRRGLEGVKKDFTQQAKDFVQLGREMGGNYAEAFSEAAQVMFAGVDTSAIDEQIQKFISFQEAQRNVQPAEPSPDQGFQLGPELDVGNQEIVTQEDIDGVNRLEEAEKRVTRAILEGADARIKAREAEAQRQKALDRTIERNIAYADQSIQTAQDVGESVIQTVRQIVQAKIAETIAKAIASIPFPANLVLGAAAAGAINALFNSVMPKFAYGGMISGPGGPRDDRVPILASNGEFVVNARSVQAAPNTIRKINRDPAFAERMERQSARPRMRTSGRRAPAAVATTNTDRMERLLQDQIATTEDQTRRLEAVERIVKVSDVYDGVVEEDMRRGQKSGTTRLAHDL